MKSVSRREDSKRYNTPNIILKNNMLNNFYQNNFSNPIRLSNNICPTDYSYRANINPINIYPNYYINENIYNPCQTQQSTLKRNFSTPAIFSPKINLNSPPLNASLATPSTFSTYSKNSNDSSQNRVSYPAIPNYQTNLSQQKNSVNYTNVANPMNYSVVKIPQYVIPIKKISVQNLSSIRSFNKNSNISNNSNNNLNNANPINKSLKQISLRPYLLPRNQSYNKIVFVPKLSNSIIKQNNNITQENKLNNNSVQKLNNNSIQKLNNNSVQKINNYSVQKINNYKVQKLTKSTKFLNNKIEPGENFNPDEFTIIKQIGSGSYGKIYSVEWIKNKQKYALKKETKKTLESLKKNLEKTKMLLDFIKKTKSIGVIKVYGFMYQNRGKNYIYYELMEIAERDWEQELFIRQKYAKYYTEQELFIILTQLVKTLSLLQKNHITHRDVKPQNVLISKGIYKISDFGEARVLIRDGIVCSRVRGTELYMSPILFHGLHVKLVLVNHNTYKSDVFSLGMCLFFAATLTFDSLCDIRELNNMASIKEVLIRYLIGRYSFKFINILLEMLQVDENLRPDFIQLEQKYFSK